MSTRNNIKLCIVILIGLCSLFAEYGYAQSEPDHFQPVSNTGNNRYMRVNTAILNGVELTSGDEIGVFDGDLCAGAVKITAFPAEFITILKYVLPV